MGFSSTPVAYTSAQSTTGLSVTTPGINTTGANLIVILVTDYFTSVPTPTDSYGNTWTALTQYINPSFRAQFFYCYNPIVGAGHTFNESNASALYPAIAVQAWTMAAVSPFDVQNGSTTNSPGSITPTANNELIITGIGGGNTVTSVNSGFTATALINNVNAQGVGIGMAYLVQGTAAAISPTWTAGGTTVSNIASFKPGLALASNITGIQSITGIQTINF